MFLALVTLSSFAWADPAPVQVNGLSLEGEIEGENVIFAMSFEAEASERGAEMPLVIGDAAYLEATLPRGAEILRVDDRYVLRFARARKGNVVFRFASRPVKDGDWRRTSFRIPSANTRKLAVLCDRDDLEVQFPGALDVQRAKNAAGRMQVTAFLGLVDRFQVAWKPLVRRLDAELVVSCDVNTIATAGIGVLRVDNAFTYRIIQGQLTRLTLALPEVNVTQVLGEDIQDWRLERTTDGAGSKLVVTLGRPREGLYRLRVESEMNVPKFPCKFGFPVIAPEQVLRASGFVMIGADSAIKLVVGKAGGLTQVDPAAFPTVAMEGKGQARRPPPTRSVYAYQFAAMPYAMDVDADDIVTAMSADSRIVLTLEDRDLAVQASVELDVRDAPAREVVFETGADPSWTVTAVTGKQVAEADVDVREEAGVRRILVPFKQAVSGSVLVDLRMEKTLAAGAAAFTVPGLKVVGAKNERGYIVVASEKGIRLRTDKTDGLREVHTGSAPMRVAGAQQAFRFKEAGWQLALTLERTAAAMHSELFHLLSLGDGVLYYSATITYHIGGAPVQEFLVRVPADVETVEFTGADVEGWTRTNDLCRVRMQKRAMGDYTLLVTFDRQFDYEKADIPVGGVETVGTESEVGYLALASSASLRLTEPQSLPAAVIAIDRDEIPKGYSAPVKDPILRAFKYVRSPHAFSLRVERLDTERLLSQIADYIKVETSISRDGEAVTTATYFIKNATRQYLVARLPKGVKLWSINTVDPSGARHSALSQQSEQGVLIPVARPRDPNVPIQVEITYASSHGKLGFWRSGLLGLTLPAPALPEAHATFSGWHIAVPERFSIAGVSGGMDEAPVETRRAGLAMAAGCAARVWARLPHGVRSAWRALAAEWRAGRSVVLTETVRLSSADAETVRLRVMPAWIGPRFSFLLLALGVVAGVAALAAARGSAFRAAVGLTLLALGVCELAVGRALLVVALYLAVAAAAVWAVVAAAGFLRRRSRAARERRESGRMPARRPPPVPALPFEPAPQPTSAPAPEVGSGPAGGHATIGLLAALAAGALAAAAFAGQERAPAAVQKIEPPAPVMKSVTLSIEGPRSGRDIERSAAVTARFQLEAEGAFRVPVLPAGAVLTTFELASRELRLEPVEAGYALVGTRRGSYDVRVEYRVPVSENQGVWSVSTLLPANLKNYCTIRLPELGMDLRSEAAVLFSSVEVGPATVAEAVFGPGSTAGFTWRPRARTTKSEQAVFFADVNVLATLQLGVIELAGQIRFQVAQGEVRDFRFVVPPGMGITAVKGAGLATWSFDPDKRLLEVVLERPVSGDYTLVVGAQIGSEGLPYTASIGAIQVSGAARQRGALAVAATETVQVRVDEIKGANPINVEDFTAAAAMLADMDANRRVGVTVRRAYRYNEAENVAIQVAAERVLPEVRVTESGSLSIADERIVLATKLDLTVARAGVFSSELDIPEGFDVESLTGRDVSHWDDIKESGRGVVVYFKRQVTDATDVNLVVARTEKGIEPTIEVPRVGVRDARKHTGRLIVSGERGVRMMLAAHAGVDPRKASEAGVKVAGALVFEILRPGWSVTLRTEVLAPQVKPEVLQVVDLAEGMLQCRAFIRYRIENAGIKTFLIQSPLPEASLTVTGRQVARVHRVNATNGLWQVDLHGKVENEYALLVGYQVPYDPGSRAARILPVRTVGTDAQRGYLVVTCAGRVQVETRGSLEGLKADDPRGLPPEFGAGDLSAAILCYRTIRPDYQLDLSVVRHESAGVLPARIQRVRLTSVLSGADKLITRVAMDMTVGNLRLLRVKLPHDGDRLWTVVVNGRQVSTSRDGDRYCIPLDTQDGAQSTAVEFLYAGDAEVARLGTKRRLDAPSFDLPFTDIEWDLYVPATLRCHGFRGTMEYVREQSGDLRWFDASQYWDWNRRQRESNLAKARLELGEAEKMARAGQQQQAKMAYQNAYNYSLAEQGLNEDARVQLRNLVKQQFKVGLYSRRDAVRKSQNIAGDAQGWGQGAANQPVQAQYDGNFAPEVAQQVARQLTVEDNDALEAVAEKLIDQQEAAAGMLTAISVTTPEHGRKLAFRRAMQIDPSGELSIVFKTGSGRVAAIWRTLWPALVLLAALWAVFARTRARLAA
jgi:hypothetical protein